MQYNSEHREKKLANKFKTGSVLIQFTQFVLIKFTQFAFLLTDQ